MIALDKASEQRLYIDSGKLLNIYCDESCHLENDKQKVMGFGAIICPVMMSSDVNHELREIKKRYGLRPNYELKWTQVSKGEIDYYKNVIDYFLSTPQLRFRGLIIPDKSILNHAKFEQTHDQWYYKMYYQMLKQIVDDASNKYRIYVDIKDTHGLEKTNKLKEVLRNSVYDFAGNRIERIQEVRSHEIELLQLADFILGSVVYANRAEFKSTGKKELVRYFEAASLKDLTMTTSFSERKVNLLIWEPRNA